MKTVLCFGEALVDIFTNGHHQEGPLSLPNYRQYPGGAPANAAVAIAKLGGQSQFVGQVGDDPFGHFVIDALKSYRVDTQLVTFSRQAPTALAFVITDDVGERSFAFYRNQTADVLFDRENIDEAWFDAETIVHFCSNTLTDSDIASTTEQLVITAKKSGALISFDVNLRHNLWSAGLADKEQVNRLVAHADILKFTQEELLYLSANNDKTYIQELLSKGAKLILITDGENPVHCVTKTCSVSFTPPSVTAVDTTGAGDAFIGSLLFSLSQVDNVEALLKQTSSLENLLSFSAHCGAHAVSQMGAFTAFPNFSDVESYWNPL